METVRKKRLAQLMSRMVGGDKAAVFTFHDEFRGELAAAVRRAARRLHVDLDADDTRCLAVDAAILLMDIGGGWSPDGGALPWVWAERRILNLVSAFIGQHADPLDDQRMAGMEEPPASSPRELSDQQLLEAVAEISPRCRLFVEALEQVTTERNKAVVIAFRLQKMLGDPSPALTVGDEFGLRSDAVRQIVHRTKTALTRLVTSDERFADLREVGWLA